MERITLQDGDFLYFETMWDIRDKIQEELGDDMGKLITHLIKQGNYATQRIETDLVSYEMDLENYRNGVSNIQVIVEDLKDYVHSIPRMNREFIAGHLTDVLKEIDNL